jgi:hypothetical protein
MTHTDTRFGMTFLEELREQRWDDHRYYHHSRINQSLHLLSAFCFLATYALIFANQPIPAALLGWFGAMVSRQVGHFFFEPKGYDVVNRTTHEHKEEIKVGYNLRRKVILLSLWGLSPLVLWMQPTLFGLLSGRVGHDLFLRDLSVAWLLLGAAAVLARTAWLAASRNLQTGLVWCTKILTDPFHDVALYWRAPLQVARGELLDPMADVTAHG